MKNYHFFLRALTLTLIYFTYYLASSQTVVKLSNDQFQFVEGPAWDGHKSIYFSDQNGSKTIKYNTVTKAFSVIVEQSNGSNGMMFNLDNNLVICEGYTSKVIERDTNGIYLQTYADKYNGTVFNRPNDLCLDGKGGIYFTDPTWENWVPQVEKRLYYRTPQNTIIALVNDLDKPNGVILSKDGKTLYLVDSSTPDVRAYDVLTDGTLTNKRLFATLKTPIGQENTSGGDGMTVDSDGNVYIANSLGIQIFDNMGLYMKTINVPESCTNCTFGGSEMKTLFITAGKNLYSVELNVTGLRYPFDLDVVTTVPSVMESYDVSISPNPVINYTAEIKARDFDLKNSAIELFSTDGINMKHLFKVENENIKFDTTLSEGVYFLILADKQKTNTIKIIIN